MDMGQLGTSHKRASLNELESVHLNEELRNELSAHKQDLGVHEIVILSTCNRSEIYFIADDLDQSKAAILNWVADKKNVPAATLDDIYVFRKQDDAVKHLFSVASGIESMVLGENEILTQVRDAYALYQDSGHTGAYFNKIFQMATAVGKRVRTETDISRGAYSVSSIAIEAIRETMLDYFGRNILVVGLGVMGRRALKKLMALGHPNLTITNRTDAKAETFAKEERIFSLPYAELPEKAKHYDIILTAVSSREHVLNPDHFSSEESKTELVIDLGLPRNANPAIDSDSLKLISVDGLKAIAEKNVASRKECVNEVLSIIADEMHKLSQWIQGKQHGAPSPAGK
jgi:glutamyl-tRNA reductase